MPGIKIIIVGAGLAGSLLANGLQREQIEVVVYDRMARHAKREGYQIRLGGNALAGFRACLDPEMIQRLVARFGRAGGVLSSAPVIRDRQFRPLLDLTRFPSYSKSAPINRGLLRDMLADPVHTAGNLHYGKGFDRYEILNENGHERVRVWLEDGSHDDCDILIGADGAHSKINKQLGLNNISRVDSHVSFIAKSDLRTERFLAMTPELHEKPVMMFSDQKALYFAAYLPDKAQPITNEEAKPIKPDAAFDDELSSCMFALHIPTELCPKDILQADTETKWQLLSDNLQGFSPLYLEILDLIKGVDIYAYRARASTRPAANWRTNVRSADDVCRGNNRVWPLGDAIHAMLPNRGMGGNQAMRDTATLLPILVRLDHEVQAGQVLSDVTIAKACAEYENEMIPRAFAWVRKSGGTTMMPIDAETWTGWAFMLAAAGGLHMAYFVTKFLGLFSDKVKVDDAPELST